MKVEVARRYQFNAQHRVPDAPEPWCHPHWHGYTVEVVAKGERDERGFVVDTDRLDRCWEGIAGRMVDTDLNESMPEGHTTTVEDLAATWLQEFLAEVPEVKSVLVMEDDDRWGRVTA